MKIIGISGLGADYRVFKFLDIKDQIQVLEWINPLPNESLKGYSQRISKQIEAEGEMIIIAVSFGGLIAKELSNILNVSKVILISSMEQPKELPYLLKLLNYSKILSIIPKLFFTPPRFIARYMFKPKLENRQLLDRIIAETDRTFVKWAIQILISWHNDDSYENLVRIHGDADRLMKCPKELNGHIIENGHHFMIVDECVKINEILKIEIKNTLPEYKHS